MTSAWLERSTRANDVRPENVSIHVETGRSTSDAEFETALSQVLDARDRFGSRRAALALATLKMLAAADEARDLDAIEAALPRYAKNQWDDLIGPFYSVRGTAARLGVRRQAVHDRIKRGTLLATPTADGVVLVPTFQLDSANRPIPRLKELRRVLGNVAPDPWSFALWLNTKSTETLGGLSPAEAVRDPELESAVLRMAYRDAAAASA